MTRWCTRLVICAFFLLSLHVACGDSSAVDAQDAGTGDAVPEASASTPEGGAVPPPPRERHGFPLTPPSLGGYTLVDAFPGATIQIPSALVWPKVAGAAPFLLERAGRIARIEGGASRTVLDFSVAVAMMSEGGALGLALHPQFGDGSGPSPYAYVWYNAKGDPKNVQRLSRFTWMPATGTFDPGSELVMIEEQEERPEHNAGRVAFGPDGFLYFGNGDDIDERNHQRLDRGLFAGIFRIDVDSKGGAVSHPPPRQPEAGASKGYFIPNDNPFVGTPNALEEFWALGVRNPFGFSFDRATGAMWAADVGDTWREEVDAIVAGGNYEWPVREGDVQRTSDPISIGTAKGARYAFSHAEMADLTAVLGGFVYRGKAFPELVGKYVYSDWPSCRVWALDIATTPAVRKTLIENQWKLVPLALAEDEQGEIYLLHAGGISRLARDTSRDFVPKRLSETTLFADLGSLAPEPALVAYEVSSPLWSDAAVKKRWIGLPAGTRAELGDDGAWKLPPGTVFVKHFELPPSVRPQGRTRRLETRVMVVGNETTYGLTYRWNAAGTDADLLTEMADEPIADEAPGGQARTWHFPSSGQCWSCHRSENRILGFTPAQLNVARGDGTQQVPELVARGVIDAATAVRMPPGLVRPTDASAPLEERAIAYLAANCGSCHHQGASFLGGGNTWIATPGVPLAERGLVRAPHHNIPMAKAFGLRFAPLVDPGKPESSILMARIKSNDPDLRMPPLARNVVDAEGAKIVEEWIRSLSP